MFWWRQHNYCIYVLGLSIVCSSCISLTSRKTLASFAPAKVSPALMCTNNTQIHTHTHVHMYILYTQCIIRTPYYVCMCACIENIQTTYYRTVHTSAHTHAQCTSTCAHPQTQRHTRPHTQRHTTNLLACIAGPPSSSSQVTAFLGSHLLQWSPHNTSAKCPHRRDGASEQTGSLVHPRHL